MNIVCDQCRSKFNIPDDKIPAGKKATFKCPKCSNIISVPSSSKSASESEENPASTLSGNSPFKPDADPFGYIDEDVKTALVCEADPSVKNPVTAALSGLGYHMTEAQDARNALRSMRYHVYELVVVNESFSTADPKANGVLIYLERLGMSIRRNVFVVLLSKRFRTMDSMMAFNQSVDLIINVENMDEFEKILTRGIKEKNAFYRVYRESMKKVGRV